MTGEEKQKKKMKSHGRKRKYKVTPLWEMKKQIVHEVLTIENNRIYYSQWLFRPDEFPCGSCHDTANVVFSRQSPLNVVIKSCSFCGVTEPIREVNDRNIAQAVQVYGPVPITDAEVKDFVNRNRIRKEFLHPVVMRVFESKPKKVVDLENIEGLELEEE